MKTKMELRKWLMKNEQSEFEQIFNQNKNNDDVDLLILSPIFKVMGIKYYAPWI